jgi:hypothetical protein
MVERFRAPRWCRYPRWGWAPAPVAVGGQGSDRCGILRARPLVREQLRHDPFSGTIFIFRSKRADRPEDPGLGRVRDTSSPRGPRKNEALRAV